jgi:hypothetical protein
MGEFRNEREQYIKNKSRSNQGGDWWLARSEGDQTQSNASSSIAAASFLPNKPRSLASRADHDIPAPRLAVFSKDNMQSEPQDWLAHRRKKAVDKDHGKNFNILTGATV